MSGAAVLFSGVVAAALVISVWTVATRRVPLGVDPRATVVLRAARRRSLVAISLAIVVLTAGLATALLVPEWLGAGAALAPALAGAAGLLLYAATPPPQASETRTRYAASLRPRTPWNIAPRAALTALGIAFALQVGLLVFAGMTSSPDEAGRFRAITFSTDMLSSTASPYPGWFYAAPLLVGTLLLALATWVALRRIATTASLPREGLEDLDAMWRSRSARVVVGLAMAAVCFPLGGTALFAGVVMGKAQIPDVPIGWQVLATGLTILGIASVLLSIVALTLAALRAFTLPKSVLRPDAAIGTSA